MYWNFSFFRNKIPFFKIFVSPLEGWSPGYIDHTFHEAAPLVIDEAIAVGIPILTTNTISATEMIYKSKYGWVCDNSKEGIKEYIIRIMNNKEQLYEIRKNFLKEFNNSTPVSQFKSMLND